MNFKTAIRYSLSVAAVLCAMSLVAITAAAQEKEKSEAKSPRVNEKSTVRDPFKKYQPPVKQSKSVNKLEAPSIQMRIERYRAEKMAAANAHVAAPKPTTALLLSEVQVTGIFRSPRGWSAMVEATLLTPKLSYVIYPGEKFFDGQLVAIEEGRLIFRRETVWTDGRREKSVEVKPLRAPSPVEVMTAVKAAPSYAATVETVKPIVPEKQ
jgi:hypothetical protein